MTLEQTAEMQANEETNKVPGIDAIGTTHPDLVANDRYDEVDVYEQFRGWGDYAKKNPNWLRKKDESGFLPLHWAAGEKEVSLKDFEIILNGYPEAAKVKTTRQGGIPLLYSANNPHSLEKVKFLIEKFPLGVYVKDKHGDTPYEVLEKRLKKEGVYNRPMESLLKPPDKKVGGSRKRKTRRNKKNRKSRKSRKYKK